MTEESHIAPATLKVALKAFRKKLNLTRLGDESALGGRGTSSGRKSAVVAITPPDLHPIEVYDELARLGKLKKVGHGMFEMIGE
jgi:hypothetical protein